MLLNSKKYRWIVGVLLSALLSSCSFQELHQAQSIVAQADSLRQAGQMYGIDAGDSATLAQAYETLSAFNSPLLSTLNPQLSTIFSHACYHYGRLLREKNDPVSAMQVFINATHSRSRDYAILGRVYSNMGSICHLAGDFQLSYDMYGRSGDLFLQNGDSLAYYYALNDMAFELAEQGALQETKNLLCTICAYDDPRLHALKALTMAKAFAENNQYDSVLYELNQSPDYYALHYVLKANVFWHIEQIDSALYYAKKVMTLPDATEQNKYNMLYIILNYDSILQNDDIIALSAQRSDIETDVLIPLHNKWALAVQLLKHDINRRPDLTWLYAIIATLIIIGVYITIYLVSKRKKHQLLSQQIEDLESKSKSTIEQRKRQIIESCSIFANSPNIKEDLCWNDYNKMCNIINQNFGLLALKLQQTYNLSEREIKLCVLSLLNMGYESMAEMLYYSPNGIGKFKLRVAHKLGTTSKNLQQFLIEKAIES